VALDLDQRPCRGLVADLRTQVEDLEDAFGRRGGLGNRRNEPPQPSAGPGQLRQVDGEGDQTAKGQGAMNHHPPPRHQDQHAAQARDELHHRHVDRTPARVLTLQLQQAGIALVEAVDLCTLAAEGLDQTRPAEVLLEERGQRGLLVANPHRQRPQHRPQTQAAQDKQRRRRQGQETKTVLHDHHRRGDTHGQGAHLRDVDEGPAGQETDAVDIPDAARQELPGLGLVVEAE